ncbi:MAG: T9SS type A sorting domain-containing protein [Bacteroidales bacterium]|nr:T9SS type A sorting domain-containing protein [Bacteroidales bacterium]
MPWAECENSNVIDLSKLGKGYYTMRITTDNELAVRKVIRN